MNKGNVLLGALAGLAIGTVLGILFAPAKGSETRRKISDKGNEFTESLKKKFDEIVDDLTGNTSTASEETTINKDK
ncbi:MAG: YtxH domain-containing protein [Bacteroidia bacterium]|nr:YtxH domain-containing protein [Bacteroidia bacterium]